MIKLCWFHLNFERILQTSIRLNAKAKKMKYGSKLTENEPYFLLDEPIHSKFFRTDF